MARVDWRDRLDDMESDQSATRSTGGDGFLIGVDLGGTNVKLAAVTPAGRVLLREQFGTADDASAAWLNAIREAIGGIEQRLGEAVGIGVASPGLAAADGRSMAWMQGRLSAVQGLDWTTALNRRAVVGVLNDAHAAMLGEVWIGAAAGARNAVMLTLGTGVGGAILCDGRLLRGHLGRAGHLGHTSLDPAGRLDIVNTPGSLEDAIGECTLGQRSGGRFQSTRRLVEAAAGGDAEAAGIWMASVRALAAGIAGIINAVDPEVLILGGGIARADEALMRPLRMFLDQFEWRPTGEGVRIVQAQLADYAGALGAAHHAWRTTQS